MLSTEMTHAITDQSTESLILLISYYKECHETFGAMQFNTACTL